MKFASISFSFAVIFATSTMQIAAAGQNAKASCRKINTAMSDGARGDGTLSKIEKLNNTASATAFTGQGAVKTK